MALSSSRVAPKPTLPLHVAAFEGDVPGIAALIGEGADPNLADETGRTALHWAARAGQEDAARALLKWGADIEATVPYGSTALAAAVGAGQAGVVRLLLKAGANTTLYIEPEPSTPRSHEPDPDEEKVDAVRREGLTQAEREAEDREQAEVDAWRQALATKVYPPRRVRLISRAVQSGNPDAVRALLEAGLDPEDPVDAGDETGMGFTPLKFAVTFGDLAMLRLLLESGADVNAADNGAGTALAGAVMHGSTDAAQLLLEAGADPNGGMADMPPLALAIHREKPEIVALLLKHGATTQGKAGMMTESLAERTPGTLQTIGEQRGTGWHVAVLAGDVEGVRAALDEGADPNQPGDHDATALLLAAKRGTLAVVELLLDRGADARAVDRHGTNALHYAAQTASDEGPAIVRRLARAGTDPEALNNFKHTPLYLAGVRESRGIVDALREVGATVGIADAALLGDAEMVRGFLAAGVPVDAPNAQGMTALMGAALRGDVGLLRFLLEAGADVSARDYHLTSENPNDGKQALHHAVSRKHREAAQILLEAGADINARDRWCSVLQYAIIEGGVDMVRFLLERGVSVADNTPPPSPLGGLMHYTLRIEGEQRKLPEPVILPLLLEAGLDPNAPGPEQSFPPLGPGAVPLAVVLEEELPEAYAQVLLRYGANVNARSHGQTLLLQSIEREEVDKVRRLLDWGADPNQGTTVINPLDAALAQEDDALVALLRERGAVGSARLASDEFTPKMRETLLEPHRRRARVRAARAARDAGQAGPVGVIEMTGGAFPTVRMTRAWDARRGEAEDAKTNAS